MRRRDLLAMLGGAAMAWPFAARAEVRVPVIGFLCSAAPAQWTANVASFRRGLNDAGYVEGRNVAIEFRWAEGRYDRLSALAADLVSGDIAVLVATGGPDSVQAAKA